MKGFVLAARGLRAPTAARWLSIVFAVLATAAHGASLDPELLPRIQSATFEVVSAKPVDDPLAYERPLPLDLLPFQERNDKYYSIGTAFAIGDGRFVTAAHVLMVGVNSLWGQPALRDNAGRVFAIDKVSKFSLERDFVVFSLVEQPDVEALAIDPAPKAGQAVFSVGNAYGTGVVIRDGLYTSDTPEPEDGRWKWMRFSAAASPGNSGGPLIDQEGRVIGVVLAKSPNENLNYALPMAIVQQAPEDVAEYDSRMSYQFDVFDTTLSNAFSGRFELPLKLAEFFKTYGTRFDAHVDTQLKALLAKEPGRLFPNGAGSLDLLHSIATMGDFPMVVARSNNGTWVLGGESRETVKLPANGYLNYGAFGNNLLFHLRRPDDIPHQRLYGEPATVMDLLLKSGFVKRQVGAENVMVTSLGKPTTADVHTDAWRRRWQLWEWPLPYANTRLIVIVLPTPNGYVGVARYAASIGAHDTRINMLALADFVYANHDGTLAQWKEFLQHPALLPAAYDDIKIDFDYGKHFGYASRRLDFEFEPALQAIQAESVLTLGFAFFPDAGKVAWDVAEIWISAGADDSNHLAIVRNQAPVPGLDDDYRNEWRKILQRQHPYDAAARYDNDTTRISAVVGPPADASPSILYTAHYVAEGEQAREATKAKLDLMLQGMHDKER